jgi:hypothetical protein
VERIVTPGIPETIPVVRVSSDLARDAGFTVPVELTEAAWDDCVAWTDADAARTGAPQDETGRAWDVIWVASRLLKRDPRGGIVGVYRIARDAEPGARAEPQVLYAQPEPGLVTIWLASEAEAAGLPAGDWQEHLQAMVELDAEDEDG